MLYESVLLFGVLFGVSFAVLAALDWTHPLPPARRATLFGIWLVALGLYFVWQWTRGGRTLAMKTWHLRVVRADGGSVRTGQALARYLLAWHLFVPGIVFIALAAPGPALSLTALALSPPAMLWTALLDRDRQLLHDRLIGTRVVTDAPASAR